MDKLLKEAIADAKAVRETALANAKIALEEAFTPHLKSMLSKKLQAEMEGEDEESHDEGYHGEDEEEKMDEEMDSSGIGAADNKEPEEEAGDTSDIGQGPESEGSDEEGGNEDENMEDAPDQPMGEGYGMEDEDEEAPAEGMHDEEDEDLEEVLRQLEAEMADEDEEEAPAEGMHDEEEVEEAMEDEDEDKVEEGEHMEDEDEEVDEEIDLDEIIKALTEEEGMEDEDEEVAEEMEDEDSELEEYKKTVLYLKNKLSEVNLLNAKLLYTNKLFRSRNISEAQKMKVIEQFDRTTSVREVKLVYSTFAESIKRKPVNESRRVSKASKPVASTKSKKPIIGENTDFKSRMKKLANII